MKKLIIATFIVYGLIILLSINDNSKQEVKREVQVINYNGEIGYLIPVE